MGEITNGYILLAGSLKERGNSEDLDVNSRMGLILKAIFGD
jgi:hypothetical protein